MTIFNELLEYILTLREAKYKGFKIRDKFYKEFEDSINKSNVYIGLQLHGADVLILTFVDNKNKFRIGSVIELKDYV